ncbi:hypothetical protein [Candidatus Scalindua japonica]|nr:hypothetical protein [Candidatus Scalindua japonica]
MLNKNKREFKMFCFIHNNYNHKSMFDVKNRNLPFLWLSSERSIDGLEFDQLTYVRLMAYKISTKREKQIDYSRENAE